MTNDEKTTSLHDGVPTTLRVRVVTDGTFHGTKAYDANTGLALFPIKRIAIDLDAEDLDKGIVPITIETYGDLEFVGEAVVEKTETE